MGRTWLLARYLYGEEEPDGEMAWTDTATVWVMAEETQPSDAADYDVTAYAFPFTPVELYAADTPPRLQTLSGNTGEFYAGQTVYAYSVHDDVQIASLKNYGAIYATQHYINEHAETNWLDYGRYRITENKVPAHYETSGFSTEIDSTENRKTYFIEVENEPTKGFIQIIKTDALDGRPIEGVQFNIMDAGGNVVGTMTTDANGAVIQNR